MLLVFVACISNQEEIDSSLADLEELKLNEEKFLFYNDSKRDITLYFPFETDEFKFVKASLYQEDQLVLENIRINSNKHNRIGIKINSYIPSFNKIHLTLENGHSVMLSTGQHYFEKWNKPENNLNENQKGHIRFHNSKALINDENVVWISSGQFDNIEGSDIRVLLPTKLLEELDMREVKVSKDETNETVPIYTYEINILTDYFIDNGLDSIIFDAIWIQEITETGVQQFILGEQVPITLHR